MPLTEYVLALLEMNPNVSSLLIGQEMISELDLEQLPEGITAEEWDEDYSAGMDEEGEPVVTFRM